MNGKKIKFQRSVRRFKNSLPLTLLALPAIIYFIIFKYVPLYGLVLPFKDYKFSKGFFGSEWCGFRNFEFLADNTQLYIAIRNTILYNFVFIILGIFVSVTAALLLFELKNKYVKLYQTILYLPFYISWVVVAYAARAFLDMDYGLINKLIEMFGGEGVLWYSNPSYWPAFIITANVWKSFGSNAVLYYASLMGTDKSLFEAAKIDGAGKLQTIIHISIPSIKSIIVMMTILSIGKIFYGDFGLFYNLTLNSSLLYPTTDIIDTYVYRSLVKLGDMGISSAVGFLQSVFGFVLVLATNFIVRRVEEDCSLF
ncbi:MAG: sugar ABC transporter permease [Clostridia bacterium]|nr:sugar ABC transporter permease [Clostridia bacterium]